MPHLVPDLLKRLQPKERRGSKARCHFLTHGSPDVVAARLTDLAAPFATVSSGDRWMPQGFLDSGEAQLHDAPRLVDPRIGDQLKSWWLAPASQRAMTPNFDIASTCTIEGAAGLLLVEAKAHDEELNKELAGRLLAKKSSEDRKASHGKIADAIESARLGFEQATSLRWAIARDSCYQMSNRFAWAWKLTELGVSVVLVYLAFLRASEMEDKGRPFAGPEDWEKLVKAHSQPLFGAEVWGRRWACNGRVFVPLIRSIEWPLAERCGEG